MDWNAIALPVFWELAIITPELSFHPDRFMLMKFRFCPIVTVFLSDEIDNWTLIVIIEAPCSQVVPCLIYIFSV